jgi:predicted acyltransferase
MGPANSATSDGRLLSLDVLRGATIAAMILVNNAGDEPSSYWPLKHAAWNGWTPTDLIFPFFLFVVGVAMTFSFASRTERGESRQKTFLHVLWRSLLLFTIGVVLHSLPDLQFATIRFYGVLQRIALCYVISSLVILWTGRRSQWVIILSCLVGYWLLMRFVPVPGFGVPGRDIPLLDPDRNLAAWLDRKLLPGRLYEITRDPEGLLSTIPAIAICLLGVQTGRWLRSARTPRVKALGMAAFGVLGVVAGVVMSNWFPINKKLWTSSYVVFTAGMALVCFAVLYWIVDLNRWRRGTAPLLVFGANSIAAYILSEGLAVVLYHVHAPGLDGTVVPLQQFFYERFFLPWLSPPDASLFYAMAYVIVCWLVMAIFYRRRIFLKI